MPNRLSLETSPYLLQHADNPVDWYPWGAEAFERARPVLSAMGKTITHFGPTGSGQAAKATNQAFGRGVIDGYRRQGFDAVLAPSFSFATSVKARSAPARSFSARLARPRT